MPGVPAQGMAMPGVPAQGMAMPGVPAQGMAMPGVPAAGGYPAQPYAGYPGTFSAPPTQDPMWGYFTAVAGQDGEVDAEELQRCLTQTGISGTYTPFSLETCRIMIAMLDRDYTGKMGFSEFKELFAVLNGWKQNFAMVDRDCSGTVEPHEMSQCIANMGYRISPQALNAIIKRYSRSGKIYFDDYVACFVKLRALTDNFKRRDAMQQGMVNFQYDDFILCTMSL
ncbi:sorcin isoform X1 [Sinocyclocheilus rhinocerous]|uniref:sorcin isoform X1 n=2 Tax=Sinocyclocheilus rhinocerous TaxID=307959 RepID=UPI0007B90AF7|nr:PREDICTED: sorcin-like isoform X1 [Sinocyclocheilus rhinocerous]